MDKKVNSGEIQCKMLGASIEVWDHNGKKIINQIIIKNLLIYQD